MTRELLVKHAEDLSDVSNPYVGATIPASRAYKIGPHDIIEVIIFKAPELSRVVEVTHEGNIYMPLIGEVRVAGKTASTAEREISARYNSGFMKSPHINIIIKEYNSYRITVEGAVNAPGVYSTRGTETIMSAISQAKGVNHEVATTGVLLLRQEEDGRRTSMHYDLTSIKNGKTADPILENGDVVVVEESTTKEGLKMAGKIMPLATPFLWLLMSL